MKIKFVFIIFLSLAVFSISLNSVEAKCASGQLCWSSSGCGNFNIGSHHYGGSEQCAILGINCPAPVYVPPAVGGSCGSAQWSCNSGGYAGDGVSRLNGVSTWSCNGWNGGGNSGTCSYTDTTSPYLQAGCGNGPYLCNGYSGVSAQTKSGNNYTWKCTNFYNSSVKNCSGTYTFNPVTSCPSPGNKATVSWGNIGNYFSVFFQNLSDKSPYWADPPAAGATWGYVKKTAAGDYFLYVGDSKTSYVFDTTPGSKYSFYINTQSLGYLPSINARYGNETGGIDFTCYGKGVCGNASTTKVFAESVTSYPASDKFCDNGTPNPKTPSFPTATKPVTWYCLGSDNTITTDDVLCSASKAVPIITGVCGSAHTKKYKNDQTTYSPDTLCLTGETAIPAPTFPAVGKTVTWNCFGSNKTVVTDDATCYASREDAKYINAVDSIIEKFDNQPVTRMVNIGSKCKIDWKIKDNAVSNLTNLTCSVSPVGGSSINPASKSGTYESPVLSHITDFTLNCSGKNINGVTVSDSAPTTCYVGPGVKEI